MAADGTGALASGRPGPSARPPIGLFLLGPFVAVLAAFAGLVVTEHAGRVSARTHGVAALATADARVPLPGRDDVAFAASRATASTVEVSGHRCGTPVNGSGFVAGSELVVTAAHVVRQVANPVVMADDGLHTASTVFFDDGRDVAVLRVTGLSAPPLRLLAPDGTPTAILGYPGGGGLDARPATMLRERPTVPRQIGLSGTDRAPVWQVRGLVLSGDSGGPVVRADGAVVAMVVARSTVQSMLGYAVGADRIRPAIAAARDRTLPVTTGIC